MSFVNFGFGQTKCKELPHCRGSVGSTVNTVRALDSLRFFPFEETYFEGEEEEKKKHVSGSVLAVRVFLRSLAS